MNKEIKTKLTFYGGAAEVTGSATLIEVGNFSFLIDCGAFQGYPGFYKKNLQRFPFDASKLDAVIITHAHFDHCGRIPKLMAEGFKGKIYATPATRDLMELVLQDSLHVLEIEYKKTGRLPFFNTDQLEKAMARVKTVKYGEKIELSAHCSFKYHNAGHILGSASVEFDNGGKKILFSGDLGNNNAPIIQDTEKPPAVDMVVMESTYAMREHEPTESRESKLLEALKNTVQHRGVLLVPCFAMERTEEVLWTLHHLAQKHQLPDVKFYLDSPLAIRILDVFKKHPEDYDEEAKSALKRHDDFLSFPGLIKTLSIPESKDINEAHSPKVIIAASGMMEGGRILHHLQRYISLPNTTILVVGYQAEGTLGRRIVSGEKHVRIFDNYIPVHAKIVKVDSFSAHADHNALLKWLGGIRPAPKAVFLNHGDPFHTFEFAKFLRDKLNLKTIVPKIGQVFELK